MQVFVNPREDTWSQILQRPAIDYKQMESGVSLILEEVRLCGDDAVKKHTLSFDGVELNDFAITEAEIAVAAIELDADLKTAIGLAVKNITLFHNAHQEAVKKIETTAGVWCWRKMVAIEKVGLYIPGGTAPLFSTLLMLGIPAVLAGCKEIVVCTPPGISGSVNPAILYAAQLIGLKKIYKIGGVQAIAAMAYGTATVPKVYKIFGPGNQYVTCAKQILHASGLAIDIPAGPSELAVYADDTCDPAFVAADLLSQAEHGPDSQVLLVASSVLIVENVVTEIGKQSDRLSRKGIATKALKNSLAIVMGSTGAAFRLLNDYAPEHLIIAANDAELLARHVVNAGSVFLGHYTPESAGDYASGTNHTLPTNGYAKAYSGVSLDSFVKKITFQQISKEGLRNISTAVEAMAAAEGLDAHGNAVSIRLKEKK